MIQGKTAKLAHVFKAFFVISDNLKHFRDYKKEGDVHNIEKCILSFSQYCLFSMDEDKNVVKNLWEQYLFYFIFYVSYI